MNRFLHLLLAVGALAFFGAEAQAQAPRCTAADLAADVCTGGSEAWATQGDPDAVNPCTASGRSAPMRVYCRKVDDVWQPVGVWADGRLDLADTDGLTGELSDAQVANNITASSYLPLTGGTLSGGVIFTGAGGVSGTGGAGISMLGTITGLTQIVVNAGTSLSLSSLNMRGHSHYFTNTGAVTVTLPGCVVGRSAKFYDLDGTAGITINPATGDTFILDGVTLDQGEAIVSPGDRGDFIAVECLDGDFVVTQGRSGTWVEETP